jgi:hypothetical protein
MRRRDFIMGFSGAALPLVARAQLATPPPVIGYFSSRSSESEDPIREPFLKALEEGGFVVGRNVAIEYRFSGGGTIDCRRWRPNWLAARS